MAFLENLNTNTLEEWRVGDQIGIKDGYEALFRRLVAFGSGKATANVAGLTFTGTGNGLMHNLDLGVDAPTETWTITATSATNFTVSGSVSGSQLDAVVDSPYTTTDIRGTATSGTATILAETGQTFITKGAAVGDRVTNRTQGEEVFIVSVDSETQITTTALSSGDWNGDTFSVLKPGTSLISFEIRAGGTAFVTSDVWSIPVTIGALASPSTDQWILDRWDPFADFKGGPAEKNGYVHWHGPGDGTEEIYTGIRLTETPASSLFNFVMKGFTGYSEGSDFDNQPGDSPAVYTAFWQFDMAYWIVFNSRRYAMSNVVSGTYHSLYMGFFLPYGSPVEYPYPMIVNGNSNVEIAYTSTSVNFRGIHKTRSNHFVRDTAGIWLTGADSQSDSAAIKWPNCTGNFSARTLWETGMEDLDNGDKQLFPIILRTGNPGTDISAASTLGELQGCTVVTGFNNSSESVIAVSGTDHIAFEDIFRVAREDFWTLEMA